MMKKQIETTLEEINSNIAWCNEVIEGSREEINKCKTHGSFPGFVLSEQEENIEEFSDRLVILESMKYNMERALEEATRYEATEEEWEFAHNY